MEPGMTEFERRRASMERQLRMVYRWWLVIGLATGLGMGSWLIATWLGQHARGPRHYTSPLGR